MEEMSRNVVLRLETSFGIFLLSRKRGKPFLLLALFHNNLETGMKIEETENV